MKQQFAWRYTVGSGGSAAAGLMGRIGEGGRLRLTPTGVALVAKKQIVLKQSSDEAL